MFTSIASRIAAAGGPSKRRSIQLVVHTLIKGKMDAEMALVPERPITQTDMQQLSKVLAHEATKCECPLLFSVRTMPPLCVSVTHACSLLSFLKQLSCCLTKLHLKMT